MSEEKINLAPFGIAGMVAVFVFAITVVIAICSDPTWVFGENTFGDIEYSNSDSRLVAAVGFVISAALMLITGTGIALKSKGAGFWCGVFIVLGMICTVANVFKILDMGSPEQIALHIIINVFLLAAVIAGAIADYQKGRTINTAVAAFTIGVSLILLGASTIETADVVGRIMFAVWLAFESITIALIPEKVYKDEAESC